MKKFIAFVVAVSFLFGITTNAAVKYYVNFNGADVTEYYGTKSNALYSYEFNTGDLFAMTYHLDSEKKVTRFFSKNYFPSSKKTINQVVEHGPIKMTIKKVGYDNAFTSRSFAAVRKVAILDVAISNPSDSYLDIDLSKLVLNMSGKNLNSENVKIVHPIDYRQIDYVTSLFPGTHINFLITINVSDFKALSSLKVELPKLRDKEEFEDVHEAKTYSIGIN